MTRTTPCASARLAVGAGEPAADILDPERLVGALRMQARIAPDRARRRPRRAAAISSPHRSGWSRRRRRAAWRSRARWRWRRGCRPSALRRRWGPRSARRVSIAHSYGTSPIEAMIAAGSNAGCFRRRAALRGRARAPPFGRGKDIGAAEHVRRQYRGWSVGRASGRLDLGSRSNLFGKAALPNSARTQRQSRAHAIREPLNKREIAVVTPTLALAWRLRCSLYGTLAVPH